MSASTGILAVLQLVMLALLARFLTPTDFGLVAGAMLTVFLAVAIAESGVGQAIVQRPALTREHVQVGWTLSVMIGIASWGIVAALAPLVEDGLGLPGLAPLIQVVSLMFVINGLTLSNFLLTRRMQFGRLAAAELSSYVVGYCGVAITLGVLGYGAWAVIWAWLAQGAVRAALVTVMAPFPYRPSLRRDVVGQLLNFGFGLTLGRVGSWAASQVDNIVVGRYLGAAALGFYSRAYQLVQIPANLFGQVANEVLFPAMSSVQDDYAKLRRVFSVSLGFMAALSLPVSVLAAITSHMLVKIVLGPEWLPLLAAFDVIIYGLLFRTSSKLTDALQKARGAVYQRALRNLGFALMVLVGAYVGQRWGLYGVAVGVFVALALNFVWSAQLCLRLIEMTWASLLKAHFPGALLAAGAGAVGLAAQAGLASVVPPEVRFVIVWLLGVGTCLAMVRSAWRFRLLAPLAELTMSVQQTLSGKPARLMGRLLGPGYRRMLDQRKAHARRADPSIGPEAVARDRTEERIEGRPGS